MKRQKIKKKNEKKKSKTKNIKYNWRKNYK